MKKEEGLRTFLGSYRYEGKEYAFDIMAQGFEDAEARLAAVKAFGKIDGRLEMVIPAGPARTGGLLARLVVWFRNLRIK